MATGQHTGLHFFTVSVCILLGISSLWAQQEKPVNYMQLQLGWSRYQLLDEQQSPFHYQKASFPIQLSYHRTTIRLRHGVRLYYDQATLDNQRTASTLDATLGRIEGFLQFRMKASTDGGSDIWLGGAWKNQFLDRSFLFLAQSPEFTTISQHSSIEFFSSLNVLAGVEKRIGERHRVDTRLQLGFLAYLVGKAYNPQYFGEWNDNDTFLFADDFLDLELSLAYHFSIGDSFDISLMYLFRHYEYERFFVSEFENHQLMAGVGLKF